MVKKPAIENEELLIKNCLAGDRKAQFILYNRYSKVLLNTAYRLIPNIEDAKDILQLSFLKAFEHLHTLKHQNLEAWLRRITINSAINHLKKKGLQLVELPDNLPMQMNGTDVDEADTNYQLDTVYAALMKLPDGYRTVFSLYLLEGYDHKEIAGILGISVSTSLTQYSRAKQKLIQIIHKMKHDE